jgi:hypothetical protein
LLVNLFHRCLHPRFPAHTRTLGNSLCIAHDCTVEKWAKNTGQVMNPTRMPR